MAEEDGVGEHCTGLLGRVGRERLVGVETEKGHLEPGLREGGGGHSAGAVVGEHRGANPPEGVGSEEAPR